MKYKFLILIGIIFLSLNFVNATFCRQETANSSTASDGSCDLNYTYGKYAWTGTWSNSNNTYDTNWQSYGTNASAGVDAYMYINYTKPVNATSAFWSTCSNHSKTAYCLNNTIFRNCWNYDSTNIQLKVNISKNFRAGTTQYFCLSNNVGWTSLNSNSGMLFMEEAIYWDIKCWTKTGNVLFIPNGCVYTDYNTESYLVG